MRSTQTLVKGYVTHAARSAHQGKKKAKKLETTVFEVKHVD